MVMDLHQAVPVCCFSADRVSTIKLIEHDMTWTCQITTPLDQPMGDTNQH